MKKKVWKKLCAPANLCTMARIAGAAALWLLGVQFVQGRTGWDYVIYFCPFLLNGLVAIVCFRLAAPPVLSGKGAFFKRL